MSNEINQAPQVGYFIDESTKETMKLMNPGITENVIIKDICFEPSKQDGTGSMVLRFKFQDSGGNDFTHTEFQIDPEQVKKNAQSWNRDYNELLAESFQALAGKVQHILLSFIPDDKLAIRGNSWEEFSKAVLSSAGTLYKGESFRLKLVLNNKDYISFPRTAKAPFIQNMKTPNSLTINPKYDRVVATTPDQSENAAAAATFGAPPPPAAGAQGGEFNAF
jgi:hypothetical protein